MNEWSDRDVQHYLDRKTAEVENRIVSKYRRSLDDSQERAELATQEMERLRKRLSRLAIAIAVLMLGLAIASYFIGRSIQTKLKAEVEQLENEVRQREQENDRVVGRVDELSEATDDLAKRVQVTVDRISNESKSFQNSISMRERELGELVRRIRELDGQVRRIQKDADALKTKLAEPETVERRSGMLP